MREYLTAPRDYFVSPAGSDANDGMTAPFRSIQKAVTTVYRTLDVAGQQIIINVDDGVYDEVVHLCRVSGYECMGGHNELVIRGNLGTLGKVLLRGSIVGVGCDTPWRVEGFYLVSEANAVLMDFHSRFYAGRNLYGGCGGAHLAAGYGSSIEIVDSYHIYTGAQYHLVAGNSSAILACADSVVTLESEAEFRGEFAHCESNSEMRLSELAFEGRAHGRRFYADTGGGISVAGKGIDYLPGDISGVIGHIGGAWYA